MTIPVLRRSEGFCSGDLEERLRRLRPENAPVDVNATVQRVSAVARSVRPTQRLTEIPRIQGRPHVPTLTLHGSGDLFVPFSMEQIFAREVTGQHRSSLPVQRAIWEAGHCESTPDEVGFQTRALYARCPAH